MDLFTVGWQDRNIPLTPRAILAPDTAAKRLAKKLLTLSDEDLTLLRGSAKRNLIIVLGPSDKLPWVDGVQYFGIDPIAASLFLPCHSTPTIDLSIVYKAFLSVTKGTQHIIDPNRKWIVPTDSTRPVNRDAVTKWLQENK